jgi:hypothetical protein
MSEPFHLAPAAGEVAAGLCDAAAAELSGHAAELADARCGADNSWLGDCEEGRGWHRLLREQTASLQWLIERHAHNLSAFASRFRAVDGAYRDADSGGADRYRRL